jgi:ABC-2 type transport system permease protein
VTSSVTSSLARIGWLAADTVRALVRQKLVAALAVLAVVLILGGRWLQTLDFGAAPQRFIIDFGFAAISVFGTVLAVVATVQLVFGETETGTAALLFAKPVRRAEYVFGKWLGVMMLLAGFCAVAAGLVALIAIQPVGVRIVPTDETHPLTDALLMGVAVAALLQWLKLGVVVAGTLLISSYARNGSFTMMIAFIAVTIGHLRGSAVESYDPASSLGAQAGQAVLAIVPDLRLFEAADRITLGIALGASDVGWAGSYAALYAIGFGAVASWLLHHRDI